MFRSTLTRAPVASKAGSTRSILRHDTPIRRGSSLVAHFRFGEFTRKITSDAKENLDKLGRGAQENLEKLGGGAQENIDKVSGGAQDLGSSAQENLEKVRGGAQENIDKVGGGAQELGSSAQENLEKLGQKAGEQRSHWSELTQKAVKSVFDQANAKSLELKEFSKDRIEDLKQYRFGSVTEDLLKKPWGQEVVTQAKNAGKTLSGKAEYEIGDFSRDIVAKLQAAGDESAKLLTLPSELDQLRQIVLEQQILINSLLEKDSSEEDAKQLVQITESNGPDQLKPLILEQQEVLDDLLSSSAQHAAA